MEPYVITLGRQLGSGGKAVGEMIARRLGIALYDRQLLDLAARQSGLGPEFFERADERAARGVLHTVLGYLRSPFFTAGDAGTGSILSNDALFRFQSDAIREVAGREPALFVGRCADYILRDHPRRVSLFITADEPERIARLCALRHCTEAEAQTAMRRIDAARANYYNFYSARTWGAAATYDLCINTSTFGVEQTAELALRFIARKLNLPIETLS